MRGRQGRPAPVARNVGCGRAGTLIRYRPVFIDPKDGAEYPWDERLAFDADGAAGFPRGPVAQDGLPLIAAPVGE